MLFPTGMVARSGPLPDGAEQVSIVSADGEALRGVHIVPDASERSGVLVIGLGGNAWNGSDVAVFLHELYPDADVIAFHYRGYAPSKGEPSSKALMADAPLVYDFAVGRVKPKRTIAVGMSIGSGVAASLSAKRHLDGLILVTPFDSLEASVGDLYPWLPISLIFQHDINSAELLKASHIPIAIVAAEDDTLIRPARTAALRKQVPNLVFDRTIPDAGHNDIYQRAEFRQAMHDGFDVLNTAKSTRK
jgi:pimeloyl-ACP methyl ester carboxylesterase